MKRIIIYHDDGDGRCAAAIAALHARRLYKKEADIVFVPADYGEAFDWALLDNFVKGEDQVWILDFSYPADVMGRIAAAVFDEPRRKNFVWIDHHVTAIERLAELHHLPGIRKTTDAACLLTWFWCGLSPEVPEAVRLIADRDMWTFAYGDRTRHFYELFKLKDTRPWTGVWGEWLEGKPGIEKQIGYGEILYMARLRGLEEAIARFGHEEPLHGTQAKILLINYPGSGELGELGQKRGYDIVHAYVDEVRDGKLVTVHSLYSATHDVGAMAKARGGGGHKGAAGWVEAKI